MDLRLTAEQEQLVGAFSALFAKQATTERVRAAEPLGFDKVLWDQLLETGAVTMAVPEAEGGWGASLVDLALVAELVGRAVAPAPVIDTQVAARLLGRIGAHDPLAAAVAGERFVTFAVRPAAGGTARFVPSAAVADDAVVRLGDRLLLVSLEGARAPFGNLGSMPVADVDLAGAVELAAGDAAVVAFETAVDEWLALTAIALVGLGARALEIGVEYVKERKAFGVPIGSFQGISHRLADSAAALDGARLLALEAAWAEAEDPGRFAELAASAFAFASETARDVTYRSLHFHGGYGFMMEYDLQLFYRRARGWPGAFGEPAVAYRRAADRRYGAGESG
ncbi:MAG TPA: acyl-CoA dehydrogenase family protein [Acidimicrobiales bacterium]|nr:acyl-CoA dehydrogenase family protein [Acidimicrobiales bacterium]